MMDIIICVIATIIGVYKLMGVVSGCSFHWVMAAGYGWS